MANQTTKITTSEIKKIDALYKAFKVKNLKNDSLLALYKTKKLTISIFKNNTLLLQGDEKAIYAFTHISKPKKEKVEKEIDGTIGMDEVGTGDYFGPMVTCSCYLDNKDIDKVKALKVDDSKKFNDKTIRSMAKQLKKIVLYQTNVCDPATYNGLGSTFNNMNIIKAIYHNSTLISLIKVWLRDKKYKIYLDQFASRENYYKYLKIAKYKPVYIDVIETKAESKYLAVACASIIARDTFLYWMDHLSTKAGFTLPKGATEKSKIISAGKKLIKHHYLGNFAKLNFESITKEINK